MSLRFLWTDVCFLSVLLIALLLILFSLRKAHVRQSFKLIAHNAVAVSAGMCLLFFLSIAVLDSIHIETSDKRIEQSMSILDHILAPLGSVYEKSFSQPLALHLYTSQTIFSDTGVKQVYPRLKHISGAIKNNNDRKQAIMSASIVAVKFALAAVAVGWLILIIIRFLQGKGFDGSMNRVLYAALATLFTLVFLSVFCWILSKQLHLLGTGQIGQDIFYYALKSIRTGLVIGLLTTLFMMPLALILGISAGFFGGWVDDVIQYVYTTLSSIPGVLLITASVLSMQTYISNHPERFTTLAQSADARLLALCLILGVTSWTSLCRLLRAETLKLKEADYVMAARILGTSSFQIVRRHLLPNVMHIVLITLVLDFSFLVLAEAVLSYVGVGVSPLTISWGNMINGARLELAREPIVWWPMFAAFTFMFALVLSSNLFADALRDAFDPHRR